MRILFVTDAWPPLVNGVVRTLQETQRELNAMGHTVEVIAPDIERWHAFKLPSYPEIKQELFPGRRIERIIGAFKPDYIHIATEGLLGWSARRICLKRRLPFSTAYHTDFPAYLALRSPRVMQGTIRKLAYFFLHRFHAPSSAVMVASPSVERGLKMNGFDNTVRWARGVDLQLFSPQKRDSHYFQHLERPVFLYAGRISIEKNLRAFLEVKIPGSKVLIGGGPALEDLRARYPDAHFPGYLEGEALAKAFASADVFVFPSRTDTFGLVLLEACASGLRVAALPVTGPADIFADPSTKDFAVLNPNLSEAVEQAASLPQDAIIPCRFAEQFSWRACTEQFLFHLKGSETSYYRHDGNEPQL